MPATPTFHSVNEANKPAGHCVHHNNSACPPGRDIPQWERRSGTGGYRLHEDCGRLNRQGR
jgi:NADPH-dependent glutamate synthase beta subunit-like oxidoreductase